MPIDTMLHALDREIILVKQNAPLAAAQTVLLAASKGQPIVVIEEAIQAGLRIFGENRVQEAEDKWPEIKKHHPDLQLHLIGPLQTNKVKAALALFDVIQTLDRPKLAEAIAGMRHEALGMRENPHASSLVTRHFYIQVNTGEEPQKAGIVPMEAGGFIYYCREDLKLPVVGLMCIPPADQPPAPHFACLRKIAQDHGLTELSMGMSEDYQAAVRMGSTCIRLGRALFGERAEQAIQR